MGKYDDLRALVTQPSSQTTANNIESYRNAVLNNTDTQTEGGYSKYADLRNPTEYLAQKAARDAEIQKQVLGDTLNSVMRQPVVQSVTQPSVQPSAGVDFKADQAKKKQTSAFQGMLPAADLLQTPQPTIQSTLKDKVPAANLVQQTGGGPANASQIPGVSEYNIRKEAIDNTNMPEVLKLPSRAINYLAFGTPLGVGVSRSLAGNSGATRRDSTGNEVVDKFTDAINDFITPFITPTGAAVGAGPNIAPYEAVKKVLNTKIGMQYTSYVASSMLRRGLIPKASQEAAEAIARNTITETLAGPMQNVFSGLMNGQDSNEEIANNAVLGLGAGIGLGFAGSVAGELLSPAVNRSNRVMSTPTVEEPTIRQPVPQRTSELPTPQSRLAPVIPEQSPKNITIEPILNDSPITPTGPLTREQELYNKGLRGEAFTQDEIDFMLSPEFNNSNVVEPTRNTSNATAAPEVAVTTPVTPDYESRTTGVRSNYKTIQESGNVSEKLRTDIDTLDKTYQVAKNKDTVAQANKNVENLQSAEDSFMANESGSAESIATGYRVMQELDKAGEHTRALKVADKLAKDLTAAGQTIQAASLIQRLSPEGQLINLVRTASRAGKTVTEADKIKFQDLAAKVQENIGAGKRENEINAILDRLEKGENVTVADIKKLSDFLTGAESQVKPRRQPKVKDRLPNELKDTRKRDKVVAYLEDAEAAAWERIANRRNIGIVAQANNPVIDYSIIAASKVAKGIIKAESHVEDLVKLFGEDVRPIATKVFEKAQDLAKRVTGRVLEGDVVKANAAFKRITGQEKGSLQERLVDKYLMENPHVNSADIRKLRNLAKSVSELSGDNKIKADIQMQKILNSYDKSSAWDKIQALRYMAMLLNTSTQLINAASGPIMSSAGYIADILGTMIDIPMSKILKKPRAVTTYGSNPLRYMADYLKGLKIGGEAGAVGANPAGIQSTNEIHGLAYKSLYNPAGLAERALGAISKGPDYATYSAVYKSEIRKQGYLDAINNGIKNKKEINSHVRKFVNEPSEEAMLIADRIAKNTTFQRSDSTGGKIANFLNSAPPAVKPLANTVFPFVRTPVNIASSAVNLTPVGIIKGLYQLSSKSNATQREAIRTLSLGITGSAGLGSIGYYLSDLGIITGANDSGDKNVDNIRVQAGKDKYRFNTSALGRYFSTMLNGEGYEAAEQAAKYQEGDKQFDYNKLQPLAFPLAAGAALQERKKQNTASQLGGAATDAFGSLYGMSTLKGVQDVFQPSYGGTVGEKALGAPSRIIESFFKSFSPSALAQEARRQDPVVRKTAYNDGIVKDVGDYFKSRTPGLSQSLPANLTTLGQQKFNSPGIRGQYFNPLRSDIAPYTQAAAFIVDLIDRTGDTSIAPKAPEKNVRGKNEDDISVTIPIPPKRYEKLQTDIGNEIISRIMELDAAPDEELITQINDIYDEVRKQYMDEVKEEFGIYQ